jgi:hypothetical protein
MACLISKFVVAEPDHAAYLGVVGCLSSHFLQEAKVREPLKLHIQLFSGSMNITNQKYTTDKKE